MLLLCEDTNNEAKQRAETEEKKKQSGAREAWVFNDKTQLY